MSIRLSILFLAVLPLLAKAQNTLPPDIHPQTLSRGMVVDLVHPEAGETRALGCPLHFSSTPTRIDRPAPLLGEHTREVLRECGYTESEIESFIADGVVEVAHTGAGPEPATTP